MKTMDRMEREWSGLKRLWRDDAAKTFESEYLSRIIDCMRKVDLEHQKFSLFVDQEQERSDNG